MTNDPNCKRMLRRVSTLVLAIAMVASGGLIAAAPTTVSAQAAADDPCDDLFTVGPDGRAANRHQTVVQVFSSKICGLEQEVLADIAADLGQTLTPSVRNDILRHSRSEVRARLFFKLDAIGRKPAADRTATEQLALEWLADRYRDYDVAIAQTAVDEYAKWESDKCRYDPPGDFTYNSGCNFFANLFSTPSPPSMKEFIQYGATEQADLLAGIDGYDEAFVAFALDARAIAAVSAIVGGTAAVSAASIAPFAVFFYAITPFKFQVASIAAAKAGTTLAASAGIKVAAAAGPAGIILAFAVIGAIRAIQIVNETELPRKLQENLDRAEAFSADDIDWDNEAQVQQVMALFLAGTLPDVPAPAPDTIAVNDVPVFETTVAGQASQLGASIDFIDEELRPSRAWIVDGWWVIDQIGTGEPNTKSRILQYRDARGGLSSATIVGDEFVVVRTAEDGTVECSSDTCELTDVVHHLTPDGDSTQSARSAYRGAPPTITAPPVLPATAIEGDRIDLAIEATDPSGSELFYQWKISRPGPDGGAPIVVYRDGDEISYTFRDGGTHTIEAIVANRRGARTSVSATIEVDFRPVSITWETYIRVGTFANPRPFTEGDDRSELWINAEDKNTVFVDWLGDGSFIGEVSTDKFGQARFRDYPVYPEGPLDLEVWVVRDFDGVETAREVIHLSVVNAPPARPEVEIFDPATDSWVATTATTRPQFTEGDDVRARFRATDPGDDPLNFTYQWNHLAPRPAIIGVSPVVAAGEWVEIVLEMNDDKIDAPDLADLVVVAVDDAGAASTSGSAYFSVQNAPLRITSNDYTVDDGGDASIEVIVSDELTLLSEVETVTIDWGDGSDVEALPVSAFSPRSGSFQVIQFGSVAATGTHRYATSGTYSVTVIAIDDDGDPVSTTFDLVVPALRPVITGLTELDIGSERQTTSVAFTVVDNDTTADNRIVTVDWGDGTTPTVATHSSGDEFTASHVYDELGTYTITFSAVDDASLVAEAFTGNIAVPDARPGVSLGAATDQEDPTSQRTVTFDVVFSEPVSGFSGDDVVLSGGALPTTATVTPAADGQAYTVVVSGMSTTGDVGLSIPAGAVLNVNGTANLASATTAVVSYIAPITIILPAVPTTSADSGQATASITYDVATAGGLAAENVDVVCDPASGTLFPIGTTTVTCTATEIGRPGVSTVSSFDIVVTDDEQPIFDTTVVGDIDTAATGPDGARVDFAAPVASDNSGPIDVTCDPASDSLFAVGTTTITCSAADPSGNSATVTFDVTVAPQPQEPTTRPPTTRPPTPPTTRIVQPRNPFCLDVPGTQPGDTAVINITNTSANDSGFGALRSSDAPPVPSRLRDRQFSSVNFAPGSTNPNLAMVEVGSDGRVCYDSDGAASTVILDLVAVLAAAATASVDPVRLVDTRGTRPVEPGRELCVAVPSAPAGGLAIINVTVTGATGRGYGSLRSSDTAPVPGRPPAEQFSSVNFAPGTVDPNLAFVTPGGDGRICYDSGGASADVILDQVGSIPASEVIDMAPVRLVDTRSTGRVGPRTPLCVSVPNGTPGDTAVVNITNTDANGRGYGTLRSSDAPPVPSRPASQQFSSVNFASGSIDPNLALVKIGEDGRICYDSDGASTHLILDLLAVLPASLPNDLEPVRLLDTRTLET